MNMETSRRARLGWARGVAEAPTQYSHDEAVEACEVLIHFGTVDDLAEATALRRAILNGAASRSRAASRRRRWIMIAILANVVVWTIALAIGALADAQVAGRLPSIVEMIR